MITNRKFHLFIYVLAFLIFNSGCSKKDNPIADQTESVSISGSKSAATTFALHTYYVSPTGSDSNSGSISSPFRTITKAQSVAVPGDDIFFRGGTHVYTSSHVARTETTYARVFYLNKSGTSSARIRYMNYPGEFPVLDFTGVTPSGKRITAFYVTGSYITLKGLDIKGVQQTLTGDAQSECIRNTGSNNIYEALKMRDGEAIGFYLSAGANNLVLNCDAYNNWDPVGNSGNGGDNDGFGFHPSSSSHTGNVARGCRAWFNADDGFDCISAYAPVTIENCWAFNNGYTNTFVKKGNGLGFKVGGYGTDGPYPASAPRHKVLFCLAVNNKTAGFYANHHTGGIDWINNTAYRNPVNYNMLNRDASANQDVPGFNHTMYNNLGYKATSTDMNNVDLSKCTDSNNHFNLSVTISDADFVSLDEGYLDNGRQSDNTLPSSGSGFMRLVSGSDLIDKGRSSGFTFSGTAPDLGCFEFGISKSPIPSDPVTQ